MDHLLRVSRLYMLCPMFKIAGSGHILHRVASLSKSVTIWYVHGVASSCGFGGDFATRDLAEGRQKAINAATNLVSAFCSL